MKKIFTHKKTIPDVVSYAYMQVPNRTLLEFIKIKKCVKKLIKYCTLKN